MNIRVNYRGRKKPRRINECGYINCDERHSDIDGYCSLDCRDADRLEKTAHDAQARIDQALELCYRWLAKNIEGVENDFLVGQVMAYQLIASILSDTKGEEQ